MTDTRKEFEEWFLSQYGVHFKYAELQFDHAPETNFAWQACQSLNDKRIQQLLAVIEVQREALLSLDIIEHDGGIGVGLVDCVMRSDVESAIAIKPENVELVEVATFVEDKMMPVSFNAGMWDFIESPPEGYALGSKLYTIKTKA